MNDFAAFDDSRGGAMVTIGETIDYAAMNKGITPVFFIEELPDDAETAKAGTLRMRAHERVLLICAGDQWSRPVHPVTDEIKERFAEHYAKWRSTKTNDFIAGTPISAWPQAGRGFAMELAALNIRSVEDLAAVSDVNLQRIADGRLWRAKAEAWLATNKDAGAAAKYAAEAERSREETADLKRQLAELAARLDAQETARGNKRHAA